MLDDFDIIGVVAFQVNRAELPPQQRVSGVYDVARREFNFEHFCRV